MIKYFCDCCGKEAKRLQSFHYLCHLDPSGKYRLMADADGNSISGRDEVMKICIRCYNEIVSKAIVEFVRLKEEYSESKS